MLGVRLPPLRTKPALSSLAAASNSPAAGPSSVIGGADARGSKGSAAITGPVANASTQVDAGRRVVELTPFAAASVQVPPSVDAPAVVVHGHGAEQSKLDTDASAAPQGPPQAAIASEAPPLLPPPCVVAVAADERPDAGPGSQDAAADASLEAVLQEALHFCRYAVAAYGWVYYMWIHRKQGGLGWAVGCGAG